MGHWRLVDLTIQTRLKAEVSADTVELPFSCPDGSIKLPQDCIHLHLLNRLNADVYITASFFALLLHMFTTVLYILCCHHIFLAVIVDLFPDCSPSFTSVLSSRDDWIRATCAEDLSIVEQTQSLYSPYAQSGF